MIKLTTVRELLRYSEWANGEILSAAAGRTDEQLDRPFEMGMGTLRRTLVHILAGESVWLERWQGRQETPWPDEEERLGLEEIRGRLERTSGSREVFLATLRDEALERRMVYRDSRGLLFAAALGQMMLQVCVHSTLHRAQALHMLRHVGATLPRPGLDYIFWRLNHPEPPATFDQESIRTFYAYGDAAMRTALHAAAELGDNQLDRPFEMGCGTLRATLLHIRFAEQWWLENWTRGPGNPFPELPSGTPVAEIACLFDETAAARNALLATLAEGELARIVEAVPRPGVTRRFPLGVTMLQLCCHGVHHRAQAVNMLRRVGGRPPELDYMVSVRQPV
jgi:uncharacterized damage-inducible protein DinB